MSGMSLLDKLAAVGFLGLVVAAGAAYFLTRVPSRKGRAR